MRAGVGGSSRGLALACLLLACSSTPATSSGAAGTGGASDSGASDSGTSTCTVGRDGAPKLPGSRDPLLLARAAVVVGSCIPDDGIDRNLAEMWASDVNNARSFDRSVLQAACLASTTCGCGAVTECLGYQVVLGAFGSSKRCSGSTFTECVQPASGSGGCFSFECGAVGLACDPLVVCSAAPALACDETTFAPSCDQARRPQLCSSGGGVPGGDCAALGLTCDAGQCVGGGAACAGGLLASQGEVAPAGLGCAGTMLDACVGGKHAPIDCAKRGPGFSCQSVGGHFFCGLAAECVPGNEPFGGDARNVKCEGNTVVLCNAGRLDRVDCRALGFAGCEVDASKAHYGCIPSTAN
jgi:hypothetical protein